MRYEKSAVAHFCELDDEVVVLNTATNRYIGLNESAAIVWKQLVDGHSIDEVVSVMRQTYDAPEEVIRRDAEAVIQQMLEAGLITLRR